MPETISPMNAEDQIAALGLSLPPAPPRGGVYRPIVIAGNMAYVSGHGPYLGEGGYLTRRVASEVGLEEGRAAARQTGLALLATLKGELGSLNRVKRVVKLLGMVNSTPEFTQQPEVINGASDLLVEVFGEKGRHARSAVGMAALPRNITVEIEMIVEVE